MKNLNSLRFFNFITPIIFLIGVFVLLTPAKTFASTVLFQDKFDAYSNGSFPDKWQVIKTSDSPLCPQLWEIGDGVVGIEIDDQSDSCTTNIIPTDLAWNNQANNYTLDLDVTFGYGTDHNVVYRMDSTGIVIYELHFQAPNDFVMNLPSP